MTVNVDKPNYLEPISDADYAEAWESVDIREKDLINSLTPDQMRLLVYHIIINTATVQHGNRLLDEVVHGIPINKTGVILKKLLLDFVIDPKHAQESCEKVHQLEAKAKQTKPEQDNQGYPAPTIDEALNRILSGASKRKRGFPRR